MYVVYTINMVRLNRNILTKKQMDNLYLHFSSAVAPDNPRHAGLVLSELLGQEEQIMIAKRLTTAVLLVEGTSRYKVGKILKLSQSTVEHIAQQLKQGHFDYTLQKISRSKKDYFAFLDALDSILHLGGILPHYNGLSRYKSLH